MSFLTIFLYITKEHKSKQNKIINKQIEKEIKEKVKIRVSKNRIYPILHIFAEEKHFKKMKIIISP